MVGSYIDIYIYIGSDWFRHLVRFVEFIPVDQKVTCGRGGILAVPKGGSSLGIVKAPGIDVSKGNNGNYRTQETHGNSILSWYSVRWFPEDFPFNYSNDLLKVCCCICWLGQSRVRGLNAETRGVARQALHCIKFQEALLPDDLMWIRDHFESLVEVNSSHSSENIWNVLFNISESMGKSKKWSWYVHGLSTPSPFSEHLKTPIILAPLGPRGTDHWGAGMLRSPTVSFGLWRWDELIRWIP